MNRLLAISILFMPSTYASESITQNELTPALQKTELTKPVRILLQKAPIAETQWFVQCPGGFVLQPPDEQPIIIPEEALTITHTGEAFSVHKQLVTHGYLIPLEGLLTIEGITYDGFIALAQQDDTAYLINHLNLEEYLMGVLPYETVPSWPDEAQKALCIASRTYALAKLAERKEWQYPYDLDSTILDQVYKGHKLYEEQPDTVHLKDIVRQTAGEILTINQVPILTMFSSVCGGVIPGLKKADIFEIAPHLKRMYACTHCEPKEGYYRWETSLPFSRIEEVLPDVTPLEDIKIDGYDDAGIAQNVLLKTNGTWVAMSAHEFRLKLLPQLRSICCTFEVTDKTLYAQGKGYGHHIGLCQWGTFYMVQKGYTYEEILDFYYPGTELEKS